MGKPDDEVLIDVTVEDQYDRDRYSLGPFTRADAHAWCDAHNGAQLRAPATWPDAIRSPTEVGVWSLATAAGYDVPSRLLHLLRHPEDIPGDADAIAARAGARSVFERELEALARVELTSCWCAALRAGEEPVASREQLAAWVHHHVRRDPKSVGFVTAPHDGDLWSGRCGLCGGALLGLRIEHEGFGDSVHSWLAAPSVGIDALIASGALGAQTAEPWFARQVVVHVDGLRAWVERFPVVGYAGLPR